MPREDEGIRENGKGGGKGEVGLDTRQERVRKGKERRGGRKGGRGSEVNTRPSLTIQLLIPGVTTCPTHLRRSQSGVAGEQLKLPLGWGLWVDL